MAGSGLWSGRTVMSRHLSRAFQEPCVMLRMFYFLVFAYGLFKLVVLVRSF
jgi:hypothetical protein